MGPHKPKGKIATLIDIKRRKKKWKEETLLKKLEKIKKVENWNEVSETEQANESIIDNYISTLSVAVPGSILENAQSPELRTYLAGQIARAACIFNIDEVIVFDDLGSGNIAESTKEIDLDSDQKPLRRCCSQFARILQYLECPQYLRKHFFPIHKDLKYAGLLNPLDAPHHLRQNEDFPFREGVTTAAGNGCRVDCGLGKNIIVDKNLEPGIRVTVKLEPRRGNTKKIRGDIVPPHMPRVETGTYWGYTVRVARSLDAVFYQSPYSGGYDLTIGTSERGDSVNNFAEKGLQEHHHALIVFGGLEGLEAALENDNLLTVDDPSLLFDHYLNTCPEQGSRTIRTEEAILISLSALRTKLNPKFQKPKDSKNIS